MGINVLAVAILCAVQTNVVSADSIKTNGVVKIDSSVVFPPMRGDPMRIDALTALILVTGGEFNDWNLRRAGIHCFAKKLGPFEYMEVKEFEPKFRRSLFEKNVLYGGQASQVVSTATVHSVSYACAVSMVRRIGDSLKKELRAMRFVEEISQGASFAIRSVEGRYGGWNVAIGFNGSEVDGWDFQLKMERSRTNAPNRQEEIGVEVDL